MVAILRVNDLEKFRRRRGQVMIVSSLERVLQNELCGNKWRHDQKGRIANFDVVTTPADEGTHMHKKTSRPRRPVFPSS